MICPKCHKEIPGEAKFCQHCGAPLGAARPGLPPIWLKLVIGLALLSVFAFWGYRWLTAHIPDSRRQNIDAPGPLSSVAIDTPRLAPSQAPNRQALQRIEISVGQVMIRDITGRPMARIPAALLQGGWVAVPVSACIGGYEWSFALPDAVPAAIDAGIVGVDDSVGIWQVQSATAPKGPLLAAWQPNQNFSWKSIVSDRAVAAQAVEIVADQRFVARIHIPETMGEPGLFVQGERIVGWTFGTLAEGGFLWKDLESDRLYPTLRVYDFYRSTFADSREEYFLLAYADGDAPLRKQLAGFARGFAHQPRLRPETTPARLQNEAVVAKMGAIADRLIQQGDAGAVAAVFDGPTLAATGSADLMTQAVQAAQIGYGFDAAVQLLEDIADQVDVLTPLQRRRFEDLYSDMYLNWLVSLIETENRPLFWDVFERARSRFPDDPRMHLSGVKMALKDGDWFTAERLLYMIEYPDNFSDQVRFFQSEISRLKTRAGKIVLRFRPGSRQVPAEAVLNGSLNQRFILDTGASMTTIPRSTAEQLGLDIDRRAPLRRIYTAGGMKEAPEVTLEAITLGGWRVENVKALVIDLPGQPQAGLLGMNYLQRFQIDLDSNEGVLTLAPR